jgi:hypothetical protein
MKRAQTTCFGLAFGLLMLVPATETVEASTFVRRSRCHRVFVSSPEAARTRRRKPKFSAAEIMDIQFKTLVSRRLTGQHSLELKVYTPKGNLYQSMTFQFDADAPIPEGARRRSRRFQEVKAILPVAGTSIVTSSMYGIWRVEAFLDGANQRCSRPRKFVIDP